MRASWDPIGGEPSRVRPSRRPERTGVRSRSRAGRLVATYGWRAYAVPFLVAVTVLAVVDVVQPGTPTTSTVATSTSADGTDPGSTDFGSLSTGADGPDIIGVPPAGDGTFNPAVVSGSLPDGGTFPVTGAGTWHVVPGSTGQVGTGTTSVIKYTVEVEDGMDTTPFGGDAAVASLVDQTLANPKSWTSDGRFALQRIDSGTPTFRISLSSQMTVRADDECGYQIELETSCYNRTAGRVVLNVARWVRGAIAFQGDTGSYRQYMVNHEVGHAIGFRQHQPCESDGGLAPVMMQQTFGVANDAIAALDPAGVVPANGFTCRFNPWPFPRG
ncbi:DUF3152 domain-containing protein [Rhodococcus antarcticus]|uniref:DUF3152 domain-containing protein n=1 Tax=Rhodococcus antarcticus TaxID=2987751 RepID=A0ABY6P4Q5_9NOCA|nr:DUF3152 domain-containing protein [Rhodococcus antarcticus]UZJ26645.1 DUF3152 domain-containing protein [Rhodococcus antarcticus]